MASVLLEFSSNTGGTRLLKFRVTRRFVFRV